MAPLCSCTSRQLGCQFNFELKLKAHAGRILIASGCVLAAAILSLILVIGARTPPVSISVIGYRTNEWLEPFPFVVRKKYWISAEVALTNNSGQPVIFMGWRHDWQQPDYRLLHEYSNGCFKVDAEYEYYNMRGPVGECVLQPSQGLTFFADVSTKHRCKIAFDYFARPYWNTSYMCFPYWVRSRLMRPREWFTGYSMVIDVRDSNNRAEPPVDDSESSTSH